MRHHAIVTSIGTDGDIYPFLSLALELRRRGYRVTLATHEHFALRARSGGLDFKSLVSAAETEQLLAQHEFWHPVKSAWVIARWGARLIPRQYETLRQLSSDGSTFLISSPGVVAARVVQEEIKVPLISVFLQPWIIPSLHAPPAMMGGLTLPRWTPRPIGGLYFRLIHALGARLMGPEFRRLRARLGLKPMRQMFHWWFSPELVIGLFPEWYGTPQPDWPAQVRLAGFPLNDGEPATHLSDKLLKFCRQPKPVVAFTFGTGMRHATELFRTALEACRALDQRAIFLTAFRSQLPRDLPTSVLPCEFAPFHKLFPLCAAVVHHGGIGTVAQALAAGTPQLIVPFAFDQLDNALRVTSLGAGSWLKRRHFSAARLASTLAGLTTAQSAASAREVAQRVHGYNGIETAANHIDAHLRR